MVTQLLTMATPVRLLAWPVQDLPDRSSAVAFAVGHHAGTRHSRSGADCLARGPTRISMFGKPMLRHRAVPTLRPGRRRLQLPIWA